MDILFWYSNPLGSDLLNSPKQQMLKHTDRLRWWDFADDYKFEFWSDETRLTDDYRLAIHPHFQIPIERSLFGDSMPDYQSLSGIFVSDPNSKSIWWIKFRPLIASHLLIGAVCPIRRESFTDMICTQHNLHKPKAMAVTQQVSLFIRKIVCSLSNFKFLKKTIPFLSVRYKHKNLSRYNIKFYWVFFKLSTLSRFNVNFYTNRHMILFKFYLD